MKIYFGFTVAGDRSSIEHAKRIVSLLESMGHEVLTKHLVREDAFDVDGLVSPEEIYHRDMKWLQQCDLFIAEASGSSFGVGYEAAWVLDHEKKAVLFFSKSRANQVSRLARGNTHPNCSVVMYTDFSEVEDFIRKHF
jgi:nucleoside 2-deoxyribosyltransferase